MSGWGLLNVGTMVWKGSTWHKKSRLPGSDPGKQDCCLEHVKVHCRMVRFDFCYSNRSCPVDKTI
jgi:hypothetical protein